MLNFHQQTWQFQDDGTVLETREVFARLLEGSMPAHRQCRGSDDPHWKSVEQRFTTIGPYGVLGELGEGTFGKVYLGVDISRSERYAAIKCPSERLLDQYAELEGFKDKTALSETENRHAARGWAKLKIGQAFSKETALTARLAMCPFVVKVVDHDVTVPYLALEFCDGGSLARRMKSQYHLVDVLRWGYEIASALEAAHGLQPDALVHRDLKPDNILLHGGRIKVSDFGTSQLTRGTGSLRSLSGGFTPVYAAPESFDNKAYPATDIWSLGVILYELLSGRRPFKGDSIMSIARSVERNDAPPLSKLGGIPAGPEMTAFVHACLSKDPRGRPGAGEARNFLRQAIGGVETLPGPAMSYEATIADTLTDGARPQTGETIIVGETAPSKTSPLPKRSSLTGATALAKRRASSASRRASRAAERAGQPRGKGLWVVAGLALFLAGWVGFAGCYPLEESLATALRGPLEVGIEKPKGGALVTDTLIRVRGKVSQGGVAVLLTYRDHSIFKRVRADDAGVFKASIAIPEDFGACRLIAEARGHLLAENSGGFTSRSGIDLWVARRPLEAALSRAILDEKGRLSIEAAVKHRIAAENNALVLELEGKEYPVSELNGRLSVTLPAGSGLVEIRGVLREKGSGRRAELRGAVSRSRRSGKSLDELLAAADRARDGSRSAEARRLYSEALMLDPRNTHALRERGRIAYSKNEYREAVKDFDRLVTLSPGDARALNLRGDARYGLGEAKGCFEDYRDAAKLDPQDANNLYDLAWVYCDLGQYDEALTLLARSLEIDPKRSWSYFARGRAYYGLKLYEKALAALDQSIELNASVGLVHNLRGDVLYDLKRYDEALASYDRAIAVDPEDGNAYYDRGWMYQDKGKQAEAIEQFNEALKRGYTSFRVYKRRGDAYSNLGQIDKALEDYSQSIAIKPDFAENYKQRGRLLRERGRLQEALADLKKAIQLYPSYETELRPEITAIEAKLGG